ncbi:LutB/LldF family L-lactate oxidation iron-sulfur protein [Arcanobacterium hippocoleae]|uniref:L-lactate dehydrogenase complex protein LldF n=1 Tax=Arcanobacterium hippocoleae TaxID=149017 RepID=A0ABU1T0T5_9ACTO|nr:LutB/LldF family L-lactate oxidation iron-sulfur protein [Arcanobacterium hippocoleae]MDR6938965.1 L-lactate dehydrogenase complex protein LldF [Arcanobacterium hippocoleae]
MSEQNLGWTPGVPIPENPLRWGKKFPKAAHEMLKNTQLRRNLKYATTTIRNKRNLRVAEMPDWQDLRDAASAIKHEVMSNLPKYLEQVERNVTARGGIVHWARDAKEANEIIHKIILAKGVDEVIKIKSMATQEVNLNEYLKERGIAAWETDLAELIVQLSEDMPSHIVVPAIHRNRAEVKAIFEKRMGEAGKNLTEDPRVLTMAAREHLRRKFLSSPVAVSGSNMIVAESGTVSIYESEGNGRMCLTLPDTLISLVGIEKIVPTYQDIEVFSQLLPRSATGERMNPYTSFWTGVTPGDGPQEFHLILMDNGRTNVLKDKIGRQALHCIRCGACMNVCPVYEHVGGHAYGSVYPGPIGAILTPQLLGAVDHKDPASQLPFASSLCGACFEACPVKIDIPSVLVDRRKQYQDANKGGIPGAWDLAMGASSKIMSSGKIFGAAGRSAKAGRLFAGKKGFIGHIPAPAASQWTTTRNLPAPPSQTYRDWYAQTHAADGALQPQGNLTSEGTCGHCGCGAKKPARPQKTMKEKQEGEK